MGRLLGVPVTSGKRLSMTLAPFLRQAIEAVTSADEIEPTDGAPEDEEEQADGDGGGAMDEDGAASASIRRGKLTALGGLLRVLRSNGLEVRPEALTALWRAAVSARGAQKGAKAAAADAALKQRDAFAALRLPCGPPPTTSPSSPLAVADDSAWDAHRSVLDVLLTTDPSSPLVRDGGAPSGLEAAPCSLLLEVACEGTERPAAGAPLTVALVAVARAVGSAPLATALDEYVGALRGNDGANATERESRLVSALCRAWRAHAPKDASASAPSRVRATRRASLRWARSSRVARPAHGARHDLARARRRRPRRRSASPSSSAA